MICLALNREIPGRDASWSSEAEFRSRGAPPAGGVLLFKPCLTPAATSLTACSAFAAATLACASASFDCCLAVSVAWAACSCRCWSDAGGLHEARNGRPAIVAIAKKRHFAGTSLLRFIFLAPYLAHTLRAFQAG